MSHPREPGGRGPEDPPRAVPGAQWPGAQWHGVLWHGDNLTVMTEVLPVGSVDLVYGDPPYNSGRTRRAERGEFSDTWKWDRRGEETLAATAAAYPQVADVLAVALRVLGKTPATAYLVDLAPRLIGIHRVLGPHGSLYLHVDQVMGHWAKVLLDAVFGAECFLNDIIWSYGLGGSSPRYWPRKHDNIFFYARTKGAHRFKAGRVPARSYRMRGADKKAPDVWDIAALNNMALERVGYPTQKPLAVLQRLIAASSAPGDLVFDPWSGSGTTALAAHQLGRRWCAADSSRAATEVASERLRQAGAEPIVRIVGAAV